VRIIEMKRFSQTLICMLCLSSTLAFAQQPTADPSTAKERAMTQLAISLSNTQQDRVASRARTDALNEFQREADVYAQMAQNFYLYEVILSDDHPTEKALKDRLRALHAAQEDMAEAERAKEREAAEFEAEMEIKLARGTGVTVTEGSMPLNQDDYNEEPMNDFDEDVAPEDPVPLVIEAPEPEPEPEPVVQAPSTIDLRDNSVRMIMLGRPGVQQSSITLDMGGDGFVTINEGQTYQASTGQSFKLVSVILDEENAEIVANLLIDSDEPREFRDQYKVVETNS